MQKQLITDQLIEEYQKRSDAKKEYLKFQLSDAQRKVIMNDIDNIAIFIRSLQSLRQQEVQNVKDAHEASDKQYYGNGNDYFTQTFEQKGGEKK